MSNARLKSLQEAALAAVKTARDIAEKAQAESREMSDDEAAEYKTAMTRGSELLEQVKAAKRDAEILDQVDSFAKEIGGLEGAGSDAETKRRAKSLGLQVVGSPQFESLMKGFGNRIPDGSRVHSDPIPVKGLFVGGNDSSAGAFVTPEQTGIVEMLAARS